MVTALPLAPAGGVGVGQAAFFSLFQIVSPAHAAAGANAFTVYQAILLAVYLTGLYYYVSYKSTQVRAAAQERRSTLRALCSPEQLGEHGCSIPQRFSRRVSQENPGPNSCVY